MTGGQKSTVYGSPGVVTCPGCGSAQAGSLPSCLNCGTKLPASSGIEPGSVIDGKYEILGLLGAGGMGEVFKSRHVHLNAFRCVKVMKKSLSGDESFRKRFLREARTATQVHHHNVAIVHDFASLADGSYYMVSEFVDGITVRQWSTKCGRFPIAFAAEIGVQTLAGLEHCHRRGLLHRDVSPDNIMIALDADGRPSVKIIDLGIAKMLAAPTSEATQVGLFVGNPKYSSPEQLGQLAEGEEIDGRTDLYSLGAVLYEMVLGIPPFSSTTPQGYVVKHLTQRARPFAEVNTQLSWPPGFEGVIFRALEKDRTKRYRNAAEFAEALAPFAKSFSIEELDRAFFSVISESHTAIFTPPPTAATATKTEVTGEGSDVSVLPTIRDGQTPVPSDLDTATAARQLARRKEDEERDRAAWQSAVSGATTAAFRKYLAAHPEGANAEEARKRVEELQLLSRIRECEEKRHLGELEEIVATHDKDSPAGADARAARKRVREAIAKEEREEQRDWDEAWKKGTVQSWEEFIQRHPRSSRVEEAHHALAETSDYEAAGREDTEAAWRKYVAKWPQGRHALEAGIHLNKAKEREMERAYEESKSSDEPERYRDFLKRYPNAARSSEIEQLLQERTAFDEALREDSEPALEKYLQKWPRHRHSSEAQKRLREVQQRDDAVLEKAVTARDAQSLRAFLDAYRGSRLRERAATLLKETQAFESALQTNSPQGWRGFLQDYPGGRFSSEAKQTLEQLEETAFQKLVNERDQAAASTFLKIFPDSRRAAEVRRLAADWEETAAISEALAAVGRGDPGPAEKLRRRIRSPERRGQLEQALVVHAEKVAWDEAESSNTIDAYRKYLRAHGEGPNAATASARVEEMTLLARIPELEKNRDETELQKIVAEAPAQSKPGAAARAALARVQEQIAAQRREAEERDWRRAWEEGSPAAWTVFLKRHPSETRSAEARQMLAEAQAFEAAEAADSLESWRQYLEKWSDGRHRSEAGVRLEWAERRVAASREVAVQPRAQEQSSPADSSEIATVIQTATWQAESITPESPGEVSVLPTGRPDAAVPRSPITAPGAPGIFATPGEPTHRNFMVWAGGIAAVAVIAIVAGVLMWNRSASTPAVDSIEVTESRVTETAITPLEPAARGTLVLDARPWAEVSSVLDAKGKNWIPSQGHYTPLVLTLPAGRYSITFRNPQTSSREKAVTVDVAAAQTRQIDAELSDIDPAEYFAKSGWR
jgi:serine/threonine protein kinase